MPPANDRRVDKTSIDHTSVDNTRVENTSVDNTRIEDAKIAGKTVSYNAKYLLSRIDPVAASEKLVSALNEKNLPLVMITLEDIKNVLYHFKYTNITICIMELVNTVVKTVGRIENNTASIQESDALYKKVISSEFMDDFFFQVGEYIRLALGASAKSGGDEHNIISEILDFVQNNYSDPNLSSQMIGDYLGKSNRYVMFKFMESVGKPLNEYIREVRMKKAANLLKNTDLPVNEIAEKIGIENENYFYKLFKKAYTITPREFSKKERHSA
jgi:YesN/AraC family two-component response regulator